MKPPAFQFYADDFLAGVADMTQAEVGAYILLLCHQWNRGSAPVEPERQQLLAKGSVSEHVLAKFQKQPDGTLKNQRLETERQKQEDYREKQRQKGISSGESRRTASELRFNRGSTVVATGSEPNSQPEANREATLLSPSPSSIRERGAPLSLEGVQEVFDEWNRAAVKSGLPQCLVVSDKRRRTLCVRLREDFFTANWKPAISRVAASKFCQGDSERGWRASLDWFIQPDSVAKIMEGKYDTTAKEVQNGF